MKKKLALALLSLTIGISSCEKQNTADNDQVVTKMEDLKVPTGFTWENSTDIYFSINITDTRFGDRIHVISIYDADPSKGGRLISKGSGSVSVPFSTKIYLANTVKEVFVVKTAPDNTSSTQKVIISGERLAISLSAISKTASVEASGGKVSGIDDSPNCTTGCTTTIANSTQNLEVLNGQTVCITGNNISVSFVGRGGTIRVCGTNVTMSGSLENEGQLIVTKGAVVTFNNFNVNGQGSVKNYGNMTVNGSFSPQSTFLNENTLAVTGDFNLNSNTSFTNNGIITVGQTMNVNARSVATNNGSITTANNFELNGQSVFVNNCFLWVKNNYNHNAAMKNYSLIKVNNQTTLNGSTELAMYSGAMLTTGNMVANALIKGYGTTSLIKVSGTSILNGNGDIIDAIQYCDANGIETNNGSFTGGAAVGCGLYIAVSNCNSEGNGTAPATDSDGDGVNNSSDEYPNDPTKAYNNYYPSASTSATVAFEDQWPKKGDYDMNDVVISYRYKIVTNAENKVVQVNGNYTLHATGGSYKNGFGIEFPISRASATGLTGGTLEAGQSKAVVILFNDMRAEMVQWNTKRGEPVSNVKTYSITFNVSGAPLLSSFGLNAYNPFIWNNGLIPGGRGYEAHMPGKTPTTLANQSLFGTGNDNSNVSAARYYVTATGLPWAINIPASPFDYSLEEVGITSGYLKFQDWAESGGTQFADWFSNTGSGYRNIGNLY